MKSLRKITDYGPWLGNGLGFFAAVALAVIAFQTDGPSFNVLLLVAGGLLGWTGGVLITPVDRGEKKKFSEYGVAISTFVGGFLFSKVERLFEAGFAEPEQVSLLRLLLFASAFLLGGLLTFIWRKYLST